MIACGAPAARLGVLAPGIGIAAAVLGIPVTMGHLAAPPAVVVAAGAAIGRTQPERSKRLRSLIEG